MPTDYLDISVPISHDMLVWSAEESVSVETHESISGTAAHRVTMLRITSHSGTHVDAPSHAIADGSTVDQMPFHVLIGHARVCDLRGTTAITADALASVGAGDSPRVLLKTDNSCWVRTGPMPEDPAYLTEDGARYLVTQGITLIGTDGLSIDHPARSAAHPIILGAGIIALEALDLSKVEPGEYHLICLPLKITGADGAPARAVLCRR